MKKEKKIRTGFDLIASCVECHQPFIITSSEQDFYRRKGLILPKRCPICRKKRKLISQKGIEKKPPIY